MDFLFFRILLLSHCPFSWENKNYFYELVLASYRFRFFFLPRKKRGVGGLREGGRWKGWGGTRVGRVGEEGGVGWEVIFAPSICVFNSSYSFTLRVFDRNPVPPHYPDGIYVLPHRLLPGLSFLSLVCSIHS